jgi:biotin operon repressor
LFSNRQIEILKSLKGKELSLDELSALLGVSIDAL